MRSVRAIRDSLVDISRRYSRAAHEAEDLAHDLVVAALRRGFAVDDNAFVRSIRGAARRHGAFLARSAGRRRAREARAAEELVETPPRESSGGSLAALSPALRTTVQLMLVGMKKAEIVVALGVSDAALRKRFQALREVGLRDRPTIATRPMPPALRRTQVEMLSRFEAGRRIAASDPDDHGLIFTEVLTPEPGTATTDRTSKGKPC